MSQEPKIILFDGVCSICDRSMQFIIKRDPKRKFVFATLQSETGQRLVAEYSLPNNLETMFLIEGKETYMQSDAVLKIAKELSGLWPVLSIFIMLPRVIRDNLYKNFSKNRYRFFGKKEYCEMVSEDIKNRFI